MQDTASYIDSFLLAVAPRIGDGVLSLLLSFVFSAFGLLARILLALKADLVSALKCREPECCAGAILLNLGLLWGVVVPRCGVRSWEGLIWLCCSAMLLTALMAAMYDFVM